MPLSRFGKGIMVTIVINYERGNYAKTFGEKNGN